MLKTHLVNRYSVYKNGSELIGVASEQDLPEITFLTDTIEGAGVGGNMDIPAVGLIDDMESTIKFLTLCQGAFSVMDPTEAVDIVVKGALQGMDAGTGATGFQRISIYERGIVKKFTPGTMKAGVKMDSQVTLGLSYYKIVIDGKTMLEIDRLNGVFVVNGNDVLKDVRDMC